jgi:hypothetical protein
MMRAATGFHRYYGRRPLSRKRRYRLPPRGEPQDRRPYDAGRNGPGRQEGGRL